MSLFRFSPRHLLFGSFAIVIIAIACGGSDDEIAAPAATATPGQTATIAPSAVPQATPTSALAPTATAAPADSAPMPTTSEDVQTVTITASKDNTLYESPTGDLSNGAGVNLFAGNTGRNLARRALIQFDLAGAIPPGATIETATIELQLDKTSSGPSDGTVHRLTADWGEGASEAEPGGGGGVSAVSGDATWIHTFFDAETWNSEGGDFVSDPSAEVSLGGFGPVSIGTSEGLVSDVQGWADDASTNFGWIIIGDESHGQTAKRFVSAEGESPDQRPRLVIGYSAGVAPLVPEPTAAATAAPATTTVPPAPTPAPTAIPEPVPTVAPTPEPAAAPGSQTFSITASKDNTLYESGGGLLSNGSGIYLFAGNTRNGLTRRALIAFDVGSIPAGSLITSVSLQMEMTKTTAGDTSVGAHRVLARWGEGASDANSNEGSGTSAAEGDATWLHNTFDSSFWDNSGGDFRAQASSETVVGGNGSYTWQSTDQLVQDVQCWVNDPAENFGWILLGDETTTRTAKRFASRSFNDSNSWPVITVEFATP